MAKKKESRAPQPPRRVQAPKVRQEGRKKLDRDRSRALLLYGGAGGGVVALAVVLVVVLGGSGSGGGSGDPQKIAGVLRDGGCTLTVKPAQASNQHMTSGNQTVTYGTYPPVTGRHHPTSAIWGNYSQPVDPRQAVHNMEHGGVVIWYGTEISSETRRQIADFYDESPNAMLVTPLEAESRFVKYPKHEPLGTKIALTAWTTSVESGGATGGEEVLATCQRFDQKAFAAFRDELRGKGPERFPVGRLTPGT